MRKVCTRCGIEKDYADFAKRSHNKSGIRAECRECTNERARIYHAEHLDKQHISAQKWKASHAEYVKAYMDKWHAAHRKPKAIRTTKPKPTQEVKREQLRRWRAANPEHNRELIRRANRKRHTSATKRLSDYVGNAIRASLRRGAKAGRRWESLVPYTVDDLRQHIERQFVDGMTWENYGSHWHIDHKIPVAAFNFTTTTDIDFLRCWSLENLQPLEARKNRMKSARIERAFQPSLAFGEGARP